MVLFGICAKSILVNAIFLFGNVIKQKVNVKGEIEKWHLKGIQDKKDGPGLIVEGR